MSSAALKVENWGPSQINLMWLGGPITTSGTLL